MANSFYWIRKFDYIIQAYPTFSNWNILKALIIGSNNLPVVEEYLPISNKDGFLTHYNTPEYKKALSDLGIEHNAIREIFKKTHRESLMSTILSPIQLVMFAPQSFTLLKTQTKGQILS